MKTSKGLETLERLENDEYYTDYEYRVAYDVIRKELKDFEWLKSKISIEWFDKLSTDDKLKLIEIMGIKYEY